MNQVYNKHLFLGPKARYLTPHGYLTPNSPEICTPKIANSLGSADSAEWKLWLFRSVAPCWEVPSGNLT